MQIAVCRICRREGLGRCCPRASGTFSSVPVRPLCSISHRLRAPAGRRAYPASRTRLDGGRRLDPGRHPHRHAAWTAEGAAALARLYQHHRECHEHGAARMPEREAMALGLDGDALDRGRHSGSGQSFRRLKAHKQLQHCGLPWKLTTIKTHTASLLAKPSPLNINLGSDRFSIFNKSGTSPALGRALRNEIQRRGERSCHSTSPSFFPHDNDLAQI
jgi:hypothetical protein